MIGSTQAGLTEELLSPDMGGDFEIVLSTFEPGAELPEAALRATDEAGYLVSGELDLWIGERQFRLAAGDSFRIRREPFRWRNPGRDKAMVVWVIAPPVY
jgi:quercetin dioxygenase-like cupin family protein